MHQAVGCGKPVGNRALFVSETTVKTHVSNLLRKLGVRDRVQTGIADYDAGVVRPKRLPSGGE
jgi:DNA-binding NarL/FixJ family response regulator